jgi:hypothetical protein
VDSRKSALGALSERAGAKNGACAPFFDSAITRGSQGDVTLDGDADVSGQFDGVASASIAATSVAEGDIDALENDDSPRRIGVSLDQCARVAKKLLDLDEQHPFVPKGCELEVSSPGINRRLRRPEHFSSAVGEGKLH